MSKVKINIPRVMLVSTGSDSGKTTITCALLKALKNKGLRPASFKCGPDYIDPMFHSKVIDTKSRNLDMYMCGEDVVKYLFAENSKDVDISVIEGVMGLYDGLGMNDCYSSNHLAKVTSTPEILIVNAKGMSLSLLAQISGYLNFRPNNIKGIIINKISKEMYFMFKEQIESQLGIKVYGFMPVVTEATFARRHLGLVTAEEISDIKNKLDVLAKTCEKTIDIDAILQLAKENSEYSYEDINIEKDIEKEEVVIAIAKDRAFCFYYEDNFALLKQLNARLVFFSPLLDERLPENIDGLILGGGYPEEYAYDLSKNISMKKDLYKHIVEKKLPVIAECGGFMYLSNSITDMVGKKYEMVGVIDTDCLMENKLSRFGYINLTAKENNMLCKQNQSIKAHEFHYSDSTFNGNSFVAKKESGKSWDCIHTKENIFAGYPHVHLWGNIEFARNFIKTCVKKRGQCGK